MADLQSFIHELEARYPEEIAYVDAPIDPLFELSALVAKLSDANKRPVLAFNNVKGTSYKVVTNVTASRKRLAFALGVAADRMGAGHGFLM